MKYLFKEKKFIYLISILISFQCLIYFLTKLFQNNYHLLESKIDLYIPFIPYFVYFYIIWYLTLILIPYLLYLKDKLMFYKYYLSYILTTIISGIIYIIYPTKILRPSIIPNNISTFLVNIIYKLDNPPINLLPSMHCSFCFLFIVLCDYVEEYSNKNIEKKYRIIILILSILIILSTLFIKQHLLIDILASFIISSLTFILVKHTKLNQVLIRLNLVK